MRNLRIAGYNRSCYSGDLLPTATAWDPLSGSCICTFGPTESNPVIELKRQKAASQIQSSDEQNEGSHDVVLMPVASWDAPCPIADLSHDRVLSLQCFPDIEVACLVLAGGDIIFVREHPSPEEEKIEIMGSVDVGIFAAAWSPDEGLLAILTRANTLLYMTRDLETIAEVTLSSADLNASTQVAVGWGKKETQFQGKRAKSLRDPTVPEVVDEGKPSSYEKGEATISWRGDGAFLAVNSVVAKDRRAIRVYSREGTLDSVSEPVDGLECALSWRPAGNIIASVQRLKDRLDIIFFERNGLRHGQFSLRLTVEEMDSWASDTSLAWNVDSTVLAVCFKDRVQLWTMGNYHYYLKQEILLQHELTTMVIGSKWHPEHALNMAILTDNRLMTLEFVSNITHGSTVPPHDYGIVAVIDGCNLKLTPLRLAGVPPPIALFELSVNEPVIDSAISSQGNRIAVLTSKSIHIFDWRLTKSPTVSKPKLLHAISLDRLESHFLRQVEFGNGGAQLSLLYEKRASPSSGLTVWTLGPEDGNVVQSHNIKIKDSVYLLFTDVNQAQIWWIDRVGSCHSLNELDILDVAHIGDTETYSKTLIKTSVFRVQNSGTDSSNVITPNETAGDQETLVYLTRQGSLYAAGRRLANSCTSFMLTASHLLFTTSQHFLKFVHLVDAGAMDVPGDTPEQDERCRSIERGARIVQVMPSSYAVVLQMPRGNLETIYPRALVLAGIRQHLDEKDYKKAFLACRNHQVDTNILCDYKFDQFMSNLQLFVKQLNKIDRIDDFLSKLKKENVAQTMYKDTLDTNSTNHLNQQSVGRTTQSNQDIPDKVNRICTELIDTFETLGPKYIQNVITAYVCKQPPDLGSGLFLVSQLYKRTPSEAESAISHLCFLTDANRLYDVALSLYNLELALLVAQQAQRDPREYLPHLQRLHELTPLRRRYEIDDHLRNYAKALTSLRDLQAHEEAEAYTLKHSLFPTALELYRYDPPRRKMYSAQYASYLAADSQNLKAAILFESIQDHAAAYPLYALAHRWRESLFCASQAIPALTAAQMQAHASSLATSLVEESRDYRSAATIYAEHLDHKTEAAAVLCKGSYFVDAMRLLALNGLAEELPQIVDAGLTEKFSEMTELLADCKGQLEAQTFRILELRKRKEEDPLAFFGGDAADGSGADIPDNLSLAPTDASTAAGRSLFTRYGSSKGAGTVMTGKSRQTSKTRRREERKKARGKKGSVYEEGYLISSVARCIDRVNAAGGEVGRVVECCWRRQMNQRARALEINMAEVVRRCHIAVDEVWGPSEAAAEPFEEGLEGRPSGADGVLWDSEMEIKERKDRPVVQQWTGPGLEGQN